MQTKYPTYHDFKQMVYQKAGTSHPSKIQIFEIYMAYLNDLIEAEVSYDAMADIVVAQQIKYLPNLTHADALDSIHAVLKKRHVHFAYLTAIQNDVLNTYHLMLEPLQSIISEDRSTYGTDEQIAMEIATLYGNISLTNFGNLDTHKQGFIAELDQLGKHNPNISTTFIDDIFSAIIAAAEGRIADAYEIKHPSIN